MAIEKFVETLKNGAASDQSANQYKAYYLSSADTGTLVSSTTQIPYGILQNKPNNANAHLTVCTQGKTRIYAGGTITAGAPLDFTTSGTATVATSGDRCYARAINAVASGNHVWAQFYGANYTTLTT